MQKVDLRKVLDMLINEEQNSAEGLLHQWFVERTKAIHENMMQDDNSLDDEDLDESDIEDDQDEIKKQHMGEADGDEDESALDTDAMNDVASGDDDLDSDNPDPSAPVDSGMDPDSSMGGDVPGDVTDVSTDPKVIADQFTDLQDDLARLKQEFMKISGGGGDASSSDPSMGDDSSVPAPAAAAPAMSPAGDGTMESAFESEDYDDLEEAFNLEKVAMADLKTPKLSGNGGSLKTSNDKSLIPGNNKKDNRVGGKPVTISHKGDYTGNKRQDSPAVKKAPLLKNQVKNAETDLEAVPAKGPKSALLNTPVKGMSSKNDKSLIGSKGSVGNNKGFK